MSGRAKFIQASRQVKRRRKFIQLLWLLGLIFVALVLIIYTLHRPRWRVNNVEVIGVKSMNVAEISSFITTETSGAYYFLIPKNSRLFYPTKTLTAKLHQSFPRIASLVVEPVGSKLRVVINERDSELLWCVVDITDAKDCYFVDTTGMAFAKAPTFVDHVLFEIYQKDSNAGTSSKVWLGQSVLSSAQLANINQKKKVINTVLANYKVFVGSIIKSVLLLPGPGYSFNVSIVESQTDQWQLLVDSKMSDETLATLLTTLIESESFNKNMIQVEQPLSYIDARLPNKVFFKILDSDTNKHATSTP